MQIRSKTALLGFGIFATLGVTSIMMQTHSAAAATTVDADTLEQRVAALEKLVARNSEKPESTVVDRLDTIERSLKMENSPADLKTADDLKEALIRTDLRQQALARQLAELQTRNTGGRASSDDKVLADVRKDVQTQERDIKDLDNRLHRIESSGFGRTGL